MIRASAPGKIILLGEHAVVYGRPAIAVPVHQVHASAEVTAKPERAAGEIYLEAPATATHVWLHQADPEEPVALAVRLTLEACHATDPPAFDLLVSSEIPMAAGLGSGAAVSVAVVRAVSQFLNVDLPLAEQSNLVYQVEKIHHGTPSGIDNTVVTYGSPVYFVRGRPPSTFHPGGRFRFVIGDTGRPSPTAEAVRQVRESHAADPAGFDALFDEISRLVEQGKAALEAGDAPALGHLMDRNQEQLAAIGVSCDELERLAQAARAQGALGAKLSGGGLGGNMIALTPAGMTARVSDALEAAGAARLIVTEVAP